MDVNHSGVFICNFEHIIWFKYCNHSIVINVNLEHEITCKINDESHFSMYVCALALPASSCSKLARKTLEHLIQLVKANSTDAKNISFVFLR